MLCKYALEVITDQCSAFHLFKKIEKLAVGIELEAGYFSQDNWTRSTSSWCASPLLFFSDCRQGQFSMLFTTIEIRITVLEFIR